MLGAAPPPSRARVPMRITWRSLAPIVKTGGETIRSSDLVSVSLPSFCSQRSSSIWMIFCTDSLLVSVKVPIGERGSSVSVIGLKPNEAPAGGVTAVASSSAHAAAKAKCLRMRYYRPPLGLSRMTCTLTLSAYAPAAALISGAVSPYRWNVIVPWPAISSGPALQSSAPWRWPASV